MTKGRKVLNLLKPALIELFSETNGFHEKTMTFHVGLQTPIMCQVEAVNGMVNREKYFATAIYISVFGERFRYDGERFSKA